MDNKKLMQFLLRDAGEMEKLISEIRVAGSFDPLDMELLQTRISGIRHMLEAVCRTEVISHPKEEEREHLMLKNQPEEVALTEIKSDTTRPQPVIKKERREEKSVQVKEIIPPPPEPIIKEVNTPAEVTGAAIGQVMEPEENESKIAREEKHILAEKFVAGKSINDLLVEKSRNDSKFQGLPLSSLTAGIGTNERFLFTRELFNGDMDQFNETLQRLDAMHSLPEANSFLRENFTWDKNETSLRFIELIKRRFTT